MVIRARPTRRLNEYKSDVMRIVLCHSHYQQPGGEDAVFADESALLTAYGHEVIPYTLHNDVIQSMNRWQVARSTLWNQKVHDELLSLLRRERPAVMHCTNTFPLISPAAYYAAQTSGVAVVQSLHNYRLLCANGLFLRGGHVCEDCLGRRIGWPGMLHACYRESRSASAVVATLQTAHWAMGTWKRMVDAYIVLTDFARKKFIAGGLPASRLHVKPNFVHPDPGPGGGTGKYAIYVGRLSQEKGIETLLAAWQQSPPSLRLKIVGDGPLKQRVREAAALSPCIEWLGHVPRATVQQLIADATMLVLPSNCYEGFPKTILEAFAVGTPVVTSRIGGMAEIVAQGRTGCMVRPGSASALAQAVSELAADPARLSAMRREARLDFETHYTADVNHRRLVEIYAHALRSRGTEVAAENAVTLVGT